MLYGVLCGVAACYMECCVEWRRVIWSVVWSDGMLCEVLCGVVVCYVECCVE